MFGDTPTHDNEEEELRNFPLSDNDVRISFSLGHRALSH